MDFGVHMNNKYYETIIKSMGEGVFIVNETGQFIETNHHYSQMLEYSSSELLNLNIRDIELNSQFDSVIFSQGYAEFESFHKMKQGGNVPVFITVTKIIQDNELVFVACVQNLSFKKNTKMKMDVVKAIFNNASEAILVTDKKGIIKLINKAFTNITGYSIKDAVGKTPAILSSGLHDEDFYQTFWSEIKTHGKWSGEMWNKRKNGEVYPEWLNIISITNKNGEITHFISQFTDITEIKKSKKKALYQTYHDSLTDLPNRRLLFERLNSLCNKVAVHSISFTVFLCNLDRFKLINDSLGHVVGDEILKSVSMRLLSNLKSTVTIARSDGDEFTIIIENKTDEINTAILAQKILNIFKYPFPTKYGDFYVSCSIGISKYPNDSQDINELLSFSGTALSKAKEQGGGGFSVFDVGQKEGTLFQIELENNIFSSFKKGEFEVWYQPQLDSNLNEVYGVECLIRWRHPQYGIISPELFIPMAEQNGLIRKLGLFVLNTACEQLAKWRSEHVFKGVMAINVSGKQFIDSSFYNEIHNILKRHNIPGVNIEIEVTESLFSDEDTSYIDTLIKLQQLGVSVAIDDFGTGYSSLSRLKSLPINNLKIDKSFVDNIAINTDDLSIIKSIVMLARSLNLELIAEGVELSEQAELLKSLGCFNHQGYLYSKPLIAKDFESWSEHYKKNIGEIND
jgi:diguanylate cyclase (GGDEF)-like protein/PAS domain S-box-containing protein